MNVDTIERFTATANYLVASRLYLKSNYSSTREFVQSDLKEEPRGHWGVNPSVSFLYPVLSSIIDDHGDIELIIGPGHAFEGLASCMYLDGTLGREFGEALFPSAKNLHHFIERFPQDYGVPYEVTPSLPGVEYMGGELGHCISFAIGSALGQPHRTIFVLVGDGELETGTPFSGLMLWDAIESSRHGRVIPVINFNRAKMGSASLLSSMSSDRIEKLIEGFGYRPVWIDSNVRDAVERVSCGLQASPEKFAIVLDLPKGWSGPRHVDGKSIIGTHLSHKAPINNPTVDNKRSELIFSWLKSYEIRRSFDAMGDFESTLLSSWGTQRLFKKAIISVLKSEETEDFHTLDLPASPAHAFSSYLLSETKKRDVFVFCPDELRSNRMQPLCGSDKVIEVLSESVCHGLSHGYAASGGIPWFVTYEAFLPIVTSMFHQYLKVLLLKERDGVSIMPINYFVTSTCWHNCFSHQNPGFFGTLLQASSPHVSIYTPIDSSTTVAAAQKCMRSNSCVNAIWATKHDLPCLVAQDQAEDVIENGYWVRGRFLLENLDAELIILAIGDVLVHECIKAISTMALAKKIVVISPILANGVGWSQYLNEALQRYRKNGKAEPKIICYFLGFVVDARHLLDKLVADVVIKGYQLDSPPEKSVLKSNRMTSDDIVCDINSLL